MSQPPNPPNPPQPPNPPPPPRPSFPSAGNTPNAPVRKSNTKACLIIGGIVLVLFIVGAFAAVSFIGSLIKGGTEKLVEKATGATGVSIVNNDGENGVSFKDKDGNEFQMTQSKEIPADFPKDVINLYKGTVTQTARTKIAERTMWTINIATPDDFNQVSKSIADQFAQNAWDVTVEQDFDDRSVRIAKKDNYNMTVTYSRNKDDGQTTINYMLHTQEKSK